MHGRDSVSVNKVSNALRMKLETKNTHRSFHGSEPGICRTAVLWQDCTGSALKYENEVNLRVCTEFMMTVQNKKRQWQLFSTSTKKKAYPTISNFKNKTQCVVQDNADNTHSSLVWPFIPDCFHKRLDMTIHIRPAFAPVVPRTTAKPLNRPRLRTYLWDTGPPIVSKSVSQRWTKWPLVCLVHDSLEKLVNSSVKLRMVFLCKQKWLTMPSLARILCNVLIQSPWKRYASIF